MVKGLGEIAVFKSYTFPLSLSLSPSFSLSLPRYLPCFFCWTWTTQHLVSWMIRNSRLCTISTTKWRWREFSWWENKNTQINPFHSLNCKSMKDSQICKQTNYNTRCNLHRCCKSFIKTFSITFFTYVSNWIPLIVTK